MTPTPAIPDTADEPCNHGASPMNTQAPELDLAELGRLHASVTSRFLLPWKAENPGTWIWAGSLKGGLNHVADVRGWGYLTGRGHGALGLSEEEAIGIQHDVGALIAETVNTLPALLTAYAGMQAKRDEAVWRSGRLIELRREAEAEVARLTTGLQDIANAKAHFIVGGSIGPLFTAGWNGAANAIADLARALCNPQPSPEVGGDRAARTQATPADPEGGE